MSTLAVYLIKSSAPFRPPENCPVAGGDEITMFTTARRRLINNNRLLPIAGYVRQFAQRGIRCVPSTQFLAKKGSILARTVHIKIPSRDQSQSSSARKSFRELNCIRYSAYHPWRVIPMLLAGEAHRSNEASSQINDPARRIILVSHGNNNARR